MAHVNFKLKKNNITLKIEKYCLTHFEQMRVIFLYDVYDNFFSTEPLF